MIAGVNLNNHLKIMTISELILVLFKTKYTTRVKIYKLLQKIEKKNN